MLLSTLRQASLTRLAVVGVVLAGFALAAAAAVSPSLHKHLHHDADEEDHECLVTQLIAGGVESVPVVPFAVEPPVMTPMVHVESEGIAAQSFFLGCSVFEHAPPVLG